MQQQGRSGEGGEAEGGECAVDKGGEGDTAWAGDERRVPSPLILGLCAAGRGEHQKEAGEGHAQGFLLPRQLLQGITSFCPYVT